MKTFRFVAFLMLWLTAVTVRAQEGTNLVRNPGFEEGSASYSLSSGVARVDDTSFRSGGHSLRFSNPDPRRYGLVTQEIPTSGGAMYAFSAQIKGEGLVSLPDAEPNRGASVCLEWFDAQGTWLGGSYPQGKLGTFDWTNIQGVATLPLNARKLVVTLYLRKGTTGTAWFDDVRVVSATPPLRVFLLSPSYHGLLRRGDRAPWRAQLSVATAWAPLRVRSQVVSGEGVVASSLVPVPASASATVQFSLDQPVPARALGASPAWRIELLDARGAVVGGQTLRFRVPAQWPRVSIAPGGAWQVGGKPFFPLGIYLGSEDDTSEANLSLIRAAGFNTVLNYAYGAGRDPRGFLDRAQKHGLKVIYSLKDFSSSSAWMLEDQKPAQLIEKHVRLVKDHPALLGWYLNDESGLEHADELRAMQNQVLSLDDGEHPILHVLYQYGDLDGYYDLADALGVDPYPLPGFPFSLVSTWTRSAHEAARGAKSAIYVPQAFSHAAYSTPEAPAPPATRAPTRDELRCLTLLGLIQKSDGLIYYSFFDLGKTSLKGKRDEAAFAAEWKNVAVIAGEMSALAPLLPGATEVALPARNSAPDALSFRVLRSGASTVLLVANADEKKAATLSLPPFPGARVQSGNVQLRAGKDALEIEVPPHGSAIIALR